MRRQCREKNAEFRELRYTRVNLILRKRETRYEQVYPMHFLYVCVIERKRMKRDGESVRISNSNFDHREMLIANFKLCTYTRIETQFLHFSFGSLMRISVSHFFSQILIRPKDIYILIYIFFNNIAHEQNW